VRRPGRWLLAVLAVLTTAQAVPSKLAIVSAILHDRREDGPGIPASYEYVPGELLYLSYRMAGYTAKNDAVDLRWQMYLTDPDGLLLEPISNGAVRDEVTSRDKDWLPKVEQTVPLPPELYAGLYAIHLRVADELAQSSAEFLIQFRVHGRAPEKLPGITVRGVRFYRGEDDAIALDPATYRPGATLWARFEIAGYSLRESNAFDVEYGLAVYGPSGNLLYEQPVAAQEHDSPFYPKRWLVGGFSLTVSANQAPGEYRLTVRARDKLAKTSAEQSANFQVKN
jgi:hypothetical protein